LEKYRYQNSKELSERQQSHYALKQIFDNSDGNGLSLQDIHHTDTSRPSLPLSYIDDNSFLSFDTREGNKPGELIGNSLRIGI
jgi:hypothetical protein